MANFSKPLEPLQESQYLQSLIFLLWKGPKRRITTISILLIFAFLFTKSFKSSPERSVNLTKEQLEKLKQKKSRGAVDSIFFKRLFTLLKIVIPSFTSPEMLNILGLSIFLVTRTYLSIYLATVKGRIVKGLMNLNSKSFIKGLVNLMLCSFPGAFVNSALHFFNHSLGILFRKRITNHFLEKYLDDITFYQITNIDQRISNPDQRLTQDIEKWSTSLSLLYGNLTKPILDISFY